jgi:hypothetical protein
MLGYLIMAFLGYSTWIFQGITGVPIYEETRFLILMHLTLHSFLWLCGVNSTTNSPFSTISFTFSVDSGGFFSFSVYFRLGDRLVEPSPKGS